MAKSAYPEPPPGWVMPPVWTDIPKAWTGERCFVICGGESVRAQRSLIPRLQGRFIVVKEGVLLRPDADVLFLGGESTDTIAKPLIPKFSGRGKAGHYMVVRGRSLPSLPDDVLRLTRTKVHTALCDLPGHVAGYDSGTSAINLAYHFGATEIVLIGFDMCGGRWFGEQEYKALTGMKHGHPMPVIPEHHFRDHLKPLPEFAEDAKRKGIRIVNTSAISRVTCFEHQPLEAFL